MSCVEILLVEDSPMDAEMTLHALHSKSIANHIEWMRDGAEALDYLFLRGDHANRIPGPPRLVLLDLKMPRVDGLEVLRAMKEDPELRRVPVVMLTSSAEESDLLRSYQLGVNSYVVKPVDFDSFSAEIAKLGFYWMLTNRLPLNNG